MPHPTSLIILGALCAGGIAAGIGLGRATVGDINPAYAKDADTSFYADLVPGGGQGGKDQPADWQQIAAQELDAAQGPPPPAACDCTWPVDPALRHDPAVDRALEAWTPPSEAMPAAVSEASADPDSARASRNADDAPPPDPDPAPGGGQQRSQQASQGPDGL